MRKQGEAATAAAAAAAADGVWSEAAPWNLILH